ncbi:hypothetical protein ABIB73_000110 [Bradyrhizobium sp. F1.4.3]|uniref:hypothetical protein n=1 Tax=Bradyrhizobium sp. F1.4.3 TaxID=3156356 RepID=UPI0033995AFA
MRFHPVDEVDALVAARVWCFEDNAMPFTSDLGPRQTVAEIVEEVRLFYGERAARSLRLTVH